VAGGTGGHLIPGIALAYELLKRGEELIFVSGMRPVEKHILKDKPFKVYQMDLEGFVGRTFKEKLRALLKMLKGIFRAYRILKEYQPKVILAEGGYVSVPLCLAGKLLGIKVFLHEQNVLPGKANRLLSKLVDKVFISFRESEKYFPRGKVIFSGNPVRRELLEPREREHEGKGILILGGSLGARFLNDLALEVIPELFKRFENLFVIHQTGLEDFERVMRAYQSLPEWERLRERIKIYPFIEDMGWSYSQADLVIARAGATTIAELISLKKPAILIPYPYAAEGHQDLNAEILVKAGSAFKFNQRELKSHEVLELLCKLLKEEELLKKMERAYEALQPPFRPEEVIIGEAKKLVEGSKNV